MGRACWPIARSRATVVRAMADVCAKIRLIGLPTDSHSSFLRGAAAAPAAIRAALASAHANMAAECGLELGSDISLDDFGDLPLDETEQDLGRISNAARDATESGIVP